MSAATIMTRERERFYLPHGCKPRRGAAIIRKGIHTRSAKRTPSLEMGLGEENHHVRTKVQTTKGIQWRS